MKNFERLFAVSILGLATVITSCEKDENQTTSSENTEAIPSAISLDVLDKIEALSFNTSDVTYEDFMLPDGTTEKRYMVEGDIALSEEYLNTMELNGGVKSEQYRTNNLVRQGSVIRVLGFTGGRNALSQANRTGLQWAVDNYNNENLSIRMTLNFGTDTDNYDMVIYKNPNERGAGGSAGFPSNGRPNKFIQIYGLDNSSNNVNEHVIGHEMGHSIGFRHTDWFSRQSCRQSTNEGSGGVGAVYIPGTARGFDPTSLMLSCFNGGVNGEFNNNDKIALDFLY